MREPGPEGRVADRIRRAGAPAGDPVELAERWLETFPPDQAEAWLAAGIVFPEDATALAGLDLAPRSDGIRRTTLTLVAGRLDELIRERPAPR